MKRVFSWKFLLTGLLIFLISPLITFAASQDLVLRNDNLWFNTKTFTEGKQVRIYSTVQNKGTQDLKGVVRFFDGEKGPQLKGDQPISVVSTKEDTVFVDIIFIVPGDHEIVAKIIPFDYETDDSSNNVARKTITVLRDFDKDGIPNELDEDDDNDGTPDINDAFPQNPNESKDADSDGTGDNTDPDDDNDGTSDISDAFPKDAGESKDSDKDGVGDNKDAFPDNPKETADYDKDGIGNNADTDADSDGIPKNQDTNDLNLRPNIAITDFPTFIQLDKEVTFNLSTTKDPDGKIAKISAKVETPDKTQIDLPVGLTKIAKHSFKKPGNYTVRIEAVDDKGESTTKEMKFKVSSVSPVLFMTTVFLVLTGLILAIFAAFTYASRAKMSFRQKTVKLLKKKYPFLKKIL